MGVNATASGKRKLTGKINTIKIYGENAYEIAVRNGYEGTVEEWLESLRGPKGDPGYTPQKGIDYDDGEKGEKGDKGDPGVSPTIGENGNWFVGDTDTGQSSGGTSEIPTFDLYEMGLPALLPNEEYSVEDVDCTTLMEALGKGFVRLEARYGTEAEYWGVSHAVSGTYFADYNAYLCAINGATYDDSREDPVVMWQGFVVVGENLLMASYREVQKALSEWTGGSY